jgi:hypothetical protein
MPEILGLDLSISNTGYCKCNADSSTFEITALRSIKTVLREEHTKNKVKIIDRVYSLQERMEITLDKLIEIGLAQPELITLIGVENYAFSAIGNSATDLAELQGIIRFFAYKNGLKRIVISPGTLKAHVGCTKKDMVPMRARIEFADSILRWGVEIKVGDEADAMVLCQLTWLYYRWSNGLEFNVKLHKKLVDRLHLIKKSAEE